MKSHKCGFADIGKKFTSKSPNYRCEFFYLLWLQISSTILMGHIKKSLKYQNKNN